MQFHALLEFLKYTKNNCRLLIQEVVNKRHMCDLIGEGDEVFISLDGCGRNVAGVSVDDFQGIGRLGRYRLVRQACLLPLKTRLANAGRGKGFRNSRSEAFW